jgi:hypothetical protein
MAESIIKLSKEQLIQIRDRGYTWVMLHNGSKRKVTVNDLSVKKEDIAEIDKFLIDRYLRKASEGVLSDVEKMDLNKLQNRANERSKGKN